MRYRTGVGILVHVTSDLRIITMTFRCPVCDHEWQTKRDDPLIHRR
jgi:hypothetical protein